MRQNIYFIDRPSFNKDFSIRYEFEQLKKLGYNVKALDLTAFLKGKEFVAELPSELEEFVIRFNTRKEAKEFIFNNAQNSLIITIVPFIRISAWLYRAIFKSGIKYILLNSVIYPNFTTQQKKDRKQKAMRSIKRLTPFRLIRKLYDEFVYHRAKNVMRYADVVLHSKKDEKWINHQLVGETTRKAYTFAPDYKIAKQIPEDRIIKEPYAVFVDQYFCHHIDFKNHHIKHSFSAEDYYPTLNKFLHSFSKVSGLRVVIACHPRRSAEHLSDFDPEFSVYFNKTPHLVKDAELMIQHFSTAVSFSVIFEKPFLLLNSKMFKGGGVGEKINGFAKFFNKRLISMDEPFKLNKEEMLYRNIEKFELYSNLYLKHPNTKNFLNFSDKIDGIIKDFEE